MLQHFIEQCAGAFPRYGALIKRFHEIIMHILIAYRAPADMINIDFWQQMYRYDENTNTASGWLVLLAGGQYISPVIIDQHECGNNTDARIVGLLGYKKFELFYEPVIDELNISFGK